MSTWRPMSMGAAIMYRRLCLLGDLDRQTCDDSSDTVSRYDTTGSDTMMGAPPMKSSWRSLRQISRWSSPAPAMMFSPDSSVMICTRGSDLERRLRPSTSLGRSDEFLTWTATRTTGDTEYFIWRMLWAPSKLEMVPVFRRYESTPTRAHVLPAGTSATCSTVRPIMMTVRWMFLIHRSVFLPGTKLGPMMRAFMPVAILPEKTRPKA
mmetsp:Transcript_12584/g.27326  ORF Transcript_12584/g.27326 Transcript_12584/m.27326 type:complete len:208 (+) Transcript_12584:850-1473(+)